jgi:two-component system C4-dicarboxylate transport sensor histidine kinase DctB
MEKNILVRGLEYLGKCNGYRFIALVTLLTTFISMLVVSSSVYLFLGTLPTGYLILSILMPLVLTPAVLGTMLKLVSRLSCCTQALQKEIEKSHQKDILLFEQERFALMGEMLSSISHQWRQPLNAINLTLLSARVTMASKPLEDDDLDKLFNTIEDNTHYLSNTIEDFRTFFQNKAPKEIVPLKEIIHELNTIISPILNTDRIALEVEWDSNLIDRLQLATAISQVLLNLISNSKDAMQELPREKKYVNIAVRKRNRGITIAVADNGPGIKKEVRPKIFDPYFTTKGKLKGSGIGLHMSRQIIEKIFEGSIVLADTSEAGSRFVIDLPYSDCCILEDGDW